MKKSRKRKPTGPKLAVIEEVADDIYSVKFILQSLGYDVVSLSYRQDLLPQLKAFGPRLVIIDMMIPGGGAFSVIRSVRSVFADLPILAITADAMDGESQDVLQAGGQDCVSKPYTVPQLQEKLDKWFPKDAVAETSLPEGPQG